MDSSTDPILGHGEQAKKEVSGGAHILVVDDSRLSAMKLVKAMNALGHESEIAENGAVALRRLRETSFDLILLDIVMPEMDGYAVLEELKTDSALRDIPVIVVSSLDDEIGNVVRAIELGAVDFLPKQFEPAILRARLEASLDRKRLRDRELEYFQHVEELTQAAQVISAGAFRPVDLDVAGVATRRDPLGELAVVFHGLAHEVYERERRADRTVRTLRGTLLVLVAGGIFGVAPALGRLAAGLGAPSLGLVVWANVVAAITCFVIGGLRGARPRLRKADLPFFLFWALVLGCLYQFSMVAIAKHVEASMIALIGSGRGFMVFALAALIALERPNLRRLAGLGIGFAAVAAVLVLRGIGGEGENVFWLASALVLPLLLAIHTLLMTWRPRDLDAFVTVGIVMAFSAMMLMPLAYGTGTMFWPSIRIGQLDVIILALGAASGVAVALALDLVATAGAVFAGQMAYAQTLAGIAWSMLLLGERLPPIAWGAFGLVILGFWLVQPREAGDEFSVTVPIGGR